MLSWSNSKIPSRNTDHDNPAIENIMFSILKNIKLTMIILFVAEKVRILLLGCLLKIKQWQQYIFECGVVFKLQSIEVEPATALDPGIH